MLGGCCSALLLRIGPVRVEVAAFGRFSTTRACIYELALLVFRSDAVERAFVGAE